MDKNVIIKRQKSNTYNETDFIYSEEGNYITKQQNLHVRNRFNSKRFKYNEEVLTVLRWERLI